jgi:hypothetical protein
MNTTYYSNLQTFKVIYLIEQTTNVRNPFTILLGSLVVVVQKSLFPVLILLLRYKTKRELRHINTICHETVDIILHQNVDNDF